MTSYGQPAGPQRKFHFSALGSRDKRWSVFFNSGGRPTSTPTGSPATPPRGMVIC